MIKDNSDEFYKNFVFFSTVYGHFEHGFCRERFAWIEPLDRSKETSLRLAITDCGQVGTFEVSERFCLNWTFYKHNKIYDDFKEYQKLIVEKMGAAKKYKDPRLKAFNVRFPLAAWAIFLKQKLVGKITADFSSKCEVYIENYKIESSKINWFDEVEFDYYNETLIDGICAPMVIPKNGRYYDLQLISNILSQQEDYKDFCASGFIIDGIKINEKTTLIDLKDMGYQFFKMI